ncbi:MAG: SpvB/TcaC N-terminal domain-containing protein [Polyangiales bacterium]|nr:VCBS repeat-containing protein [Myxococcales bacterium]MCB9657808.1 VCBS repeat-containing protein [Sandaracinaceae bacterium]
MRRTRIAKRVLLLGCLLAPALWLPAGAMSQAGTRAGVSTQRSSSGEDVQSAAGRGTVAGRETEARGSRHGAEEHADAEDEQRRELTGDEEQDSVEERVEPGEGEEQEPEGAEPKDLPGAEQGNSSVTPQAISLPNAEGSIEGMGESFTPNLSSGTATFGVPIALPAGRAGVQPSLGLGYSSTSGNGVVGIGWGMSVPFIARQTDRGLPRYDDRQAWHAQEDRFIYNGGQELVPVDSTRMGTVDASGLFDVDSARDVPTDVATWQQYRARVEGGFMRFFRSPDGRRWVVQGKDGTRFDFGELPAMTGPPDLDSRLSLTSELGAGHGRIFSWYLTRMSDAHGSTVYYRYLEDRGHNYLADIYYVSPNSCAQGGVPDAQRACRAPLSQYAAHVQITYDTARPDVFSSYTMGWRTELRWRVRMVTVTMAEEAVGTRYLVRRYHLAYHGQVHHSLLASVQVEGRPNVPLGNAPPGVMTNGRVLETALEDSTVGELLPPMTFEYSQMPLGSVAGFGGVDNAVHNVAFGPDVSVDLADADLYDVNTDGLPDLIVTEPARYRTASGAPAAGVFFNGFRGASTTPAGRAGVFSDAVPVPMRGDLSGVMRMRNANIAPMDVDGDGRGDLLHMPRLDRYGYFTPTRRADEEVDYSVRPAQQGWGFTYAEVELDNVGDDPRIDLVRDGAHYKMWDVNNDHLVDVVRTTGTVMQTWMNLGWAPGGEGRFGQAIYNEGSGTWTLSTAPLETCLLHDGNPVDFSDSEIRLADMNGDGVQDIVRMRRGRLVYWPGRGEALWGDGPATCGRNEGAGRERHMENAPPELNPDLSGVFTVDVNEDGLSDVVQVRYRNLDVWMNVNGERFTARQTFASPFAPEFASNVRFADIDGSGTTDLVYGRAGEWQYMDLLGGVRPRLLTRVHNGLGAATTLTYASAAEDYTRDLVQADQCPGDCGGDEFQWSQVGPPRGKTLTDPGPGPAQCPWGDQLLYELSGRCVYRSGGTPVLSTVVRAVSTTDNFNLLGRAANVTRSEFKFHEGYYEGIEQEFRGFGAADAVAIGDEHHGTQYVRTYFHQGRRPSDIASDRLAENPFEALKGRQWYTETYDAQHAYLATAHGTVVARHLVTGLDGRVVWYAYVSQTDEFRYHHAEFVGAREERELPWLQFEGVDNNGGATTTGAPYTWRVPVRSARFAHVRGTTDVVDNVGNVWQQTTHGRLQDEHDTEPAAYPQDLTVGHVVPALLPGGNWLWRTVESFTTGASDGGLQLGRSTQTFDPVTGDLQHTQALAQLPGGVTFEFAGTADAQGYTMPSAQVIESSTQYDAWGTPRASCASGNLHAGGLNECLRYSEVSVDEAYAQLPTSERIAIRRGRDATFCADPVANAGAPFCLLETHATWERGMGVLRTATDPNDETSSVAYDGLGRLTAVVPPAFDDCTMTGAPTQSFTYQLATADSPVSRIMARVNHGNVGCTAPEYLDTVSYVDGLGRPRVSLARRGPMEWERSGLAVLNARGSSYMGYHNDLWGGAEPSAAAALTIPTTAYTTATYDAFGRVIRAAAEDHTETHTAYGATSTTVCDALDRSSNPRFNATCTTTRVDGQGRTIDQVLRQRRASTGNVLETYRLGSLYRADGVALQVGRAETEDDTPFGAGASVVGTHLLFRTFTYDSLGRRVASTDPDSDSRDAARTDANRTWRYLFNDVGDLAAVRDPRGCGQNFYYDHAGRLIAEDYVTCAEAIPPGDLPDTALPLDAIGMAEDAQQGQLVDVRYFFDEEPDFDLDVAAVSDNPRWIGRLSGSTDRAQRSVVVYDQRGQPEAALRQMAVLPRARNLNASLNAQLTQTGLRAPLAPTTRRWDEEAGHTYVARTTYDYAGRPVAMDYPSDPDWEAMGGETGFTPEVGGTLHYNQLGLPIGVDLRVSANGGTLYGVPIVRNVTYNADRQPVRTDYGDPQVIGTLYTETTYDERGRPERSLAVRTPSAGAVVPDLNAVTTVHDFQYTWDAVSNLTEVTDARATAEWPAGYRPWRQNIEHDALYRVTNVAFTYMNDQTGAFDPGYDDAATDWREERTRPNLDGSTHGERDPMHRRPAPMVSTNAPTRVRDLTYDYDWLANQTDWTDDQGVFYERSAGLLSSGNDDPGFSPLSPSDRPSALYLSTNIRPAPATRQVGVDHGGYVTLNYGQDGNVTHMTVRSQCLDRSATLVCADPRDQSLATRRSTLENNCRCQREQHYRYDWDELNRLAEARRYDRQGASGGWYLMVQQRYRYDAGNVRVIKETLNRGRDGDAFAATTLQPYPGDYERRGLEHDYAGHTYHASTTLGTETQYLVGGARLVWANNNELDPTGALTCEQRLTLPLSDLVHSTAAVVDLQSGDLLEHTTFYPNGARETHRTTEDVSMQLEPIGFTGKEADEEVGLVYFGERYLIPRLGRWASVDPLSVHAMGGGEAMNGYHYVGGSLLQARDPLGLQCQGECPAPPPRTPNHVMQDWDPEEQQILLSDPTAPPAEASPERQPPRPRQPTLEQLMEEAISDDASAQLLLLMLAATGGDEASSPPPEDSDQEQSEERPWMISSIPVDFSFGFSGTVSGGTLGTAGSVGLNVQSVAPLEGEGHSGLYLVVPTVDDGDSLRQENYALGAGFGWSFGPNIAIGGRGAEWKGIFHNLEILGIFTIFWGDGDLSEDNPAYFGIDLAQRSTSTGFNVFRRFDTLYIPVVTTERTEQDPGIGFGHGDRIDFGSWLEFGDSD